MNAVEMGVSVWSVAVDSNFRLELIAFCLFLLPNANAKSSVYEKIEFIYLTYIAHNTCRHITQNILFVNYCEKYKENTNKNVFLKSYN